MNNGIQDALTDPTIHNLTKDILRAAIEKDPIDSYFDVQLAADLLKDRMDRTLEG